MHAATLCSRSIASQNPQPLQEQMEQCASAADAAHQSTHSGSWSSAQLPLDVSVLCGGGGLDSPCAASAVTPLLSFSL